MKSEAGRSSDFRGVGTGNGISVGTTNGAAVGVGISEGVNVGMDVGGVGWVGIGERIASEDLAYLTSSPHEDRVNIRNIPAITGEIFQKRMFFSLTIERLPHAKNKFLFYFYYTFLLVS